NGHGGKNNNNNNNNNENGDVSPLSLHELLENKTVPPFLTLVEAPNDMRHFEIPQNRNMMDMNQISGKIILTGLNIEGDINVENEDSVPQYTFSHSPNAMPSSSTSYSPNNSVIHQQPEQQQGLGQRSEIVFNALLKQCNETIKHLRLYRMKLPDY